MNARGRLRGLRPPNTQEGVSGARRLAAVCGMGVAVAIVAGGVWGVVLGVAAATAAHVLWLRATPPHVRRARERAAAELPFAVDLVAACLRAGAAVPLAAAAAAAAVQPELAERLRRTGRAAALGVSTADAFAELGDVPGTDRVVAAVAHSERTGAGLAEGMSLLADELREARSHAAQAAVQRAGVWMVLPLCLCFLPAFVLAGLAPVVAATLQQVLNTY